MYIVRIIDHNGSDDDFDIEEYIRNLTWSDEATDHDKTLVAANLRALYHHLFPDTE